MSARADPRAQRVAAKWSEAPPDLTRSFFGFPPLWPHFLRAVAGEAPPRAVGRDWYEAWAVRTVLGDRAPVARCLSLACGFGEMERILADLKAFERCEGLDIAPGAIEGAREAARRSGYRNLDYRVADLNQPDLPEATYDLVWSNGALHHLRDLDRAVPALHRALKPGGLLVGNEFVGADHMRPTPRQEELIDAFCRLLPERLRDHTENTFVPPWFAARMHRLKLYYALSALALRPRRIAVNPAWPARRRRLADLYNRLPRRPPARRGRVWGYKAYYFRDRDPSEAVRASAILPTLLRVFPQVEVGYYPGSILFHALGPRFFANYDPARGDDRLLDNLVALEAHLIAAGEVPPENAHIVARKA